VDDNRDYWSATLICGTAMGRASCNLVRAGYNTGLPHPRHSNRALERDAEGCISGWFRRDEGRRCFAARRSTFHGIRVAKWALLTRDPSECTPIQECGNSFALITAQTTGNATLSVVRSTASLDIHDYATTDIMVLEGVLEQGDEIVVTIGDVREGADCGLQTPPRSFHEVPWRGWVWDEE
jgi:hypothetical protein